jgi:ketosteroid isomerase-like protein
MIRVRMPLCAILLAASLGPSGCSRRADSDPESAKEALLAADRAFAAETAKHGADGWADAFLENGVMFPGSGRVDGREAIRRRMQIAFAPERPRLVWEPAEAVVAGSGDLGYTLGRWRSVKPGGGADSVLAEGNYVSVWRKDPDGAWRVAVDIGNTDRD